MEQKIGERQRWIWLLAGVSGIAACCACGYNWLWVLMGGLLVSLYYIYMDKQVRNSGLAAKLTEAFGVGGKILAGLTILWIVMVMGWAASLADAAFPMVDGFPSLSWVLLALAAWGSWKGPAVCAGCSGVLGLFLIALYGVVILFAVPDVSVENLIVSSVWQESVWTVGLFLSASCVLYVPCRGRVKGPLFSVVLVLPVFVGVLAAATSGVLTPELASERTVPLYDLAQSISLFGVVERIEPLLSAAITMGVFSLLSALACAGHALANEIRSCRWNGVGICAGAAILIGWTRHLSVPLLTAGAWMFWVAVPLFTVIVCKIKTTDCGD